MPAVVTELAEVQANANATTGYTKSIPSDYRSISSIFQDFQEIQFYFSSVIDAMSSLLLGWMQRSLPTDIAPLS